MNPYYSLMAWMAKHRTYTDENGEYVWVYNSGNATYKVTCNTMGSRYIVEYKLVRALTVVFDRKLHWVAYVLYALEIHALYDLAVADVKAWDYPFS